MNKIRFKTKLTWTIKCPCGRKFTLRAGQSKRCVCGRNYRT